MIALFSNVRAKLMALLLASITWYLIHEAISHEHEISEVPVTVSLSPGWALLERSAETVSIRFRGSRDDIRYLESESVQVILDLRGQEERGERNVILQPKDVRLTGSARPLRFWPPEIQFRLDEEAEKSVPVKADLVGELPPGVEMKSLVTRPATVRLSGPKSLLENVQEARTVPIDLATRLRSSQERVDLQALDSTGILRSDPARVTLEMELVERSTELVMEEVPVRMLFASGTAPQLTLNTDSVNVILQGDPEQLSRIQKNSILAYVDCSSIEVEGEYELQIRVHTPPRASVKNVEPAAVTVTVEHL